MNAVLATFRRELRAYFVSPLAYVVLFFILVVHGIIFAIIVSYLSNPLAAAGRPFDYFFNSFWFWLTLLFVTPVITMRLLAEERRSGSIEVLMTAPVTAGQVVTGKYLASLVFYAALWAPTVLYAVIVDHFSDVDWGTVGAGYLGVLLIGGLFLAIGLVGSAMTSNQIVAAIISFALLAMVFVVVFLPSLVNDPTLKEAIQYLSVVDHMEELSKGIVDTRRLVLYLSTTVFFLFLASRALEDKKWR